MLRQVRQAGVATEDGEVTAGFRSVAAAVHDHAGWPIAAVAVKGKADELSVCEVLWQESDDLTMAAGVRAAAQSPVELLVHHGAQEFVLGAERPALLLGRDAACDVVLTDPKASRQHARIAYRRFLDRHVVPAMCSGIGMNVILQKSENCTEDRVCLVGTCLRFVDSTFTSLTFHRCSSFRCENKRASPSRPAQETGRGFTPTRRPFSSAAARTYRHQAEIKIGRHNYSAPSRFAVAALRHDLDP